MKAISAETLLSNEGSFGGDLYGDFALKMKAISAANLHPNEGYFGGDFALK